MSAEKGLALPDGTKVRMTGHCSNFLKGHIVTRVLDKKYDDHSSVRFDKDDYWEYLTDGQWELIDEKPKLPDQGKIVFVKNSEDHEYDYTDPRICICIYDEGVIIESGDGGVSIYDEFYFPKIITIDNEDFHVIEKDGQKILQPIYPVQIQPKVFDPGLVCVGDRY